MHVKSKGDGKTRKRDRVTPAPVRCSAGRARRGNAAVARLVRLDQIDRSFDLRFWQAQDCADRFAAAWELVVLAESMRPSHGNELRLQRSVVRLARREG